MSSRELTMARSRTALSCKLHARQQQPAAASSSAASSSAAASSSSAAAPLAARVRRARARAARDRPLVRRDPRRARALRRRLHRVVPRLPDALALGDDAAAVGPPRRRGVAVGAARAAARGRVALFETAARIERHGCRPLDGACQPARGTIDSHVDDLAPTRCARPPARPPASRLPRPPRRLTPPRPARPAQLEFEFVEATGLRARRGAPFGPRCCLRREPRDVRRRDDPGAPRGGEPAAGGEPARRAAASPRDEPAPPPHLADDRVRHPAADRVPRAASLRHDARPPPQAGAVGRGQGPPHLLPARARGRVPRPAAPARRRVGLQRPRPRER